MTTMGDRARIALEFARDLASKLAVLTVAAVVCFALSYSTCLVTAIGIHCLMPSYQWERATNVTAVFTVVSVYATGLMLMRNLQINHHSASRIEGSVFISLFLLLYGSIETLVYLFACTVVGLFVGLIAGIIP